MQNFIGTSPRNAKSRLAMLMRGSVYADWSLGQNALTQNSTMKRSKTMPSYRSERELFLTDLEESRVLGPKRPVTLESAPQDISIKLPSRARNA